MQSTYFHVDILLTIQGSQFLMLETNEEGHRQRFWAVGLSGGEFFWLVLVFYWEEEVVESFFWLVLVFLLGGGGGGEGFQGRPSFKLRK